jgi:hypothetical protein
MVVSGPEPALLRRAPTNRHNCGGRAAKGVVATARSQRETGLWAVPRLRGSLGSCNLANILQTPMFRCASNKGRAIAPMDRRSTAYRASAQAPRGKKGSR